MTGSAFRERIGMAAMLVVAGLAMLWPAYINGGPFWFPDTSSYIRGADAATVVATGSPSEWSDRITIIAPDEADAGKNASAPTGRSQPERSASPATSRKVVPDRPVLMNRSIYYGFFLYAPMRFFGPWGAIVLQAFAIAACLMLVLSVVTRRMAAWRQTAMAATLTGLIVFTPLPFYASMLMPDVWSGVLIALLATAICFAARTTRTETILLLAGSAAIATFHMTHILLAVAVAMAGVVLVAGVADKLRGLAMGVGVAAFGYLSSVVFAVAVENHLGKEPLSPPFLTASLVDDGPGVPFLKTHCPSAEPQNAYAICDDLARLPMQSDTLLWSLEDSTGLFQTASVQRQRAIAGQDKRFFLSVVAHDPLRYAQTVIVATWRSLTDFELDNFNYPMRRDSVVDNYPPAIAADVAATRAMHAEMPTQFSVTATIATIVVSLAVIIWLACTKFGIFSRDSRFALVLVLGVLANAAICGALSKPDARYTMRMYWLLPFAACALIVRQRENDRRSAV